MAVSYFRSGVASDIGQYVSTKGGMLAVGLGHEAAEAYLNRLEHGQVVVACINSPSLITASGDIDGILELESLLKADSIFSRRVLIDAAYHSHHVEPILQPYLNFLRGMGIGNEANDDLDTIYYSSPTTGERMTSAGDISKPEHWIRSMREPVQFLDALRDMVRGCTARSVGKVGSALIGDPNVNFLIEVGPHAALSGPINEILSLPEFQGEIYPMPAA